MGAKGITLVEEGHPIPLQVPTGSTGGVGYSDVFHMKEASHASILIQTGAITNAATITVNECTGAGATGATAIAFKYCSTTATDVFGALTLGTAGGFATGTTNNYNWMIELDASELSDGYPYVCLHFTTAAAIFINAAAVLTGLRYAEDTNATMLD